MSFTREQLTDLAMGISASEVYDEAFGVYLYPDGSCATTCTSGARLIARKTNGLVVGFFTADNPTGIDDEYAGGHDFALVDGHWIVDVWLKDTLGLSNRYVYDMNDPADQPMIKYYYGNDMLWSIVHI